ncbi:hypothetical protein B0H17DRAFT_1190125 [Mycena rosella]|uniref:Uncharacterized protein n=1 Tax=Mycena rosella TaxID=1033263 RepID=A0AAD7MC76_MYCRO|nr:hypothetical protein B0H17DRAFT_1190125 [Mycena rosella]
MRQFIPRAAKNKPAVDHGTNQESSGEEIDESQRGETSDSEYDVQPETRHSDEHIEKKTRVDTPILDATKKAKLRKGFEREMKNKAEEAVKNEVIMSKFSFARAEKNQKQLDAILLSELVNFGELLGIKLPKTGGADGEGRSNVKSYKDIAGQIAGLFKLVKAWHAIGHPHEDPVPSAHILKTGRSFSCSLDLISQLHLISHRVNDIIKYMDRPHYDALKKLRETAELRHQFLKLQGWDDDNGAG